jgi:uncharacterized protein (TIGR03437 family)
MNYAYETGGSLPQGQAVIVTATSPTTFSAAASGGGWLSVTPTSGSTPANLGVSVNPTGLNPGTYNGSVTITAPGASNSPQNIAVTLIVGPNGPQITGILNGASFANDAFAPGSIVSIFGSVLGPESSIGMNVKPDNSVNTLLGGYRVLFNGHPAPLLFVQAGQINAVVPFEANGDPKARVQVEYAGAQYGSTEVPLSDAAPALFTADASGHGQGAILNHDGSPNSSINPAQKGSIVVLYGSGGGKFDRDVPTGLITGSDLARLALPATVQIDGVEAEILYAGSAPGMVAGLVQVNVKVPEQIHSGSVPVVLKIGAFNSQPQVTMAVQ